MDNTIIRFLKILSLRGLETFGRYYSTYRGFILKNEDPSGRDMLFVHIPAITGLNRQGMWAYPKGVYKSSGSGASIHLVPEIGDMVWIEFEFGDPKFPIWSFGHLKENKSSSKHAGTGAGVASFTSKKGHVIAIDDDQNLIEVLHSNGNQILLDSESINITHKDGNKMVITKDQITFNDGSNEGLINISQLVSKINDLEKRCTDLQTFINAHRHIVVPDPTTLILGAQPTVPPAIFPPLITLKSDIEDKKVIH